MNEQNDSASPGPGQLEAIWVKRMRGGPMDRKQNARVIAGRGIEGNANQGGRRQVTLIEREVWDRQTQEIGVEVDPSARRANLLVRGISLADSRDRTVRIGDCRFRIRGETRPCHILDEAAPGLKDALAKNWGAGAFAEVLDDGEIRVGDTVAYED
jgi:MOSC domain-containing protein YiiM